MKRNLSTGVSSSAKRAKSIASPTQGSSPKGNDIPNESSELLPVGFDLLAFELFETIADYTMDEDVKELLNLRLVSKQMKANVDKFMASSKSKIDIKFIRIVRGRSSDLRWNGDTLRRAKKGEIYLEIGIHRSKMPIHALAGFTWENNQTMIWRRENIMYMHGDYVVMIELIRPSQKLQDIKLRPFLSSHVEELEFDGWHGWAVDLLGGITAEKVELRQVHFFTEAIGREMKNLIEMVSAKEAIVTVRLSHEGDRWDRFKREMNAMLPKFLMRRVMHREGRRNARCASTSDESDSDG